MPIEPAADRTRNAMNAALISSMRGEIDRSKGRPFDLNQTTKIRIGSRVIWERNPPGNEIRTVPVDNVKRWLAHGMAVMSFAAHKIKLLL